MFITACRSWTDCYNIVFGRNVPAQWEIDVAGILFEKRYRPGSIRLILDHARRLGSVECCPEFSHDSLGCREIERRLPEVPECDWDRFPGTIELGIGTV